MKCASSEPQQAITGLPTIAYESDLFTIYSLAPQALVDIDANTDTDVTLALDHFANTTLSV